MAKETGKNPQTLPDEKLDEAAGGFLAFPKTSITDGTSNTAYVGGVRVAVGDVNNDGAALKIADGSVKPGA